jgi:ketol-acid reductoisomerase
LEKLVLKKHEIAARLSGASLPLHVVQRQALNLNDSGVEVWIGLRGSSKRNKNVLTEGLICKPISEIVEKCDIISILVPDQVLSVWKPHAYAIKVMSML